MKPLPIINLFFDIRRTLRQHQRIARATFDEARKLKRTASKLERASPFNHAKVADLRRQAEMLIDAWCDARKVLVSIGSYLTHIAPEFNLATTLADRCEILNVNVADRTELTNEDGLVEITWAHGLEDSAYYRSRDWKSGPLYEAIGGEIMRVMLETPEGKAKSNQMFDEMLAPGGMFYGLPIYHQQPDGTMVRKSADLTVHDAEGQHVIKREPGT